MIIGLGSGHDASCCLIDDSGNIIYAIAEERIKRVKHQTGFPKEGVDECIKIAKNLNHKIEAIVYCWNLSPQNITKKIISDFPSYLTKPSFMILDIISMFRVKKAFGICNSYKNIPCYFINHHLSHASSAFFFSPFKNALTLVLDGRGEYSSMTLFDKDLNKLEDSFNPFSIGVFYSALTQLLGFKAGDGEYKLMGLASYGKPTCLKEMSEIIEFKNGKLRSNRKYFIHVPFFKNIFNKLINSPKKLESTHYSKKLKELFKDYKKEDIASSTQKHLENLLLKLFKEFSKKYNTKEFNLAGGIFLNVVANKVLIDNGFKVFAIPFAGDVGASIGAAEFFLNKKKPMNRLNLNKLYFGNEYTNKEIENTIKRNNLEYKKSKNICKEVAQLLKTGLVIGWFQGRDEFGPRALGNRSILANPTKVEYRDRVNLAIKFREDWRPFCPSMLYEEKDKYLINAKEAPFMNLAFDVIQKNKKEIAGVVHIDNTARPQTVKREQNPKYYDLINEFKKITGIGVLLNTSFNRKNEPIVHTPQDAINCFLGTDMDFLAIGDFLVKKIKEVKK